MSNDNMWGDEDPFDDKPESAQTGQNGLPVSPTPMPSVHQYAPPVVPPQAKTSPGFFKKPQEIEYELSSQEESEEVENSEEDDYSEILSDANLRLEQGSLYKLIMKHELFQGSDADPKAIQNVQKAIRKFAREQMEIMLGMRQDPQTTLVERLEIDFPFNAVEVKVLKMIAHSASNGESENSDNYVPEIIKTTGPIPVVKEKRNTFNPIGNSSGKKVSQTPTPKKKLATRPTEPLKRSKMENTIDEIAERLADQTVSKETIKAGLRRELEEHGQLLGKSVRDLTADEIVERNREIDRRRSGQVKSSQALPMPSIEQANAMVESHSPKTNRLIELALKMPASKLLNSGE